MESMRTSNILNETLLVNVSNSTVKNIFENGMMPKLIKKTANHSVEYILWRRRPTKIGVSKDKSEKLKNNLVNA
jgi:hypothetical protein